MAVQAAAGSWTLPFAGSVGLLAPGVVMTVFMRADIAPDQVTDQNDETRDGLATDSRWQTVSVTERTRRFP